MKERKRGREGGKPEKRKGKKKGLQHLIRPFSKADYYGRPESTKSGADGKERRNERLQETGI